MLESVFTCPLIVHASKNTKKIFSSINLTKLKTVMLLYAFM